MLVSHDLKLLFAHVPKTGGSAVTAALLPYLDRTSPLKVGEHGWQPPLHEIGNMHVVWEDAKKLAMPYIAEKGYRYAATHRSPWERVSSLYQKLGDGMSIEQFARDSTDRHGWWIKPATLIAGPLVTNWMDYEHLARDLRRLLKNGGVEDPPELIHTNVTENKLQAHEVLTPAAVEIVRERFVDDIEKFGYFAPEMT